jgi:hypothetical protein
LTTPPDAVIRDTNTGEWWSIEAPGDPDLDVGGGVGFDPLWRGHTLFIDFVTYHDPYRPTLTHYEIDCDGQTVVRAVPMGPLSFNEPVE